MRFPKLSAFSQEEAQQPNAIIMAEHLKELSLQKKAKLGDGSNITEEDG
jgi:hypothetical protein